MLSMKSTPWEGYAATVRKDLLNEVFGVGFH